MKTTILKHLFVFIMLPSFIFSGCNYSNNARKDNNDTLQNGNSYKRENEADRNKGNMNDTSTSPRMDSIPNK